MSLKHSGNRYKNHDEKPLPWFKIFLFFGLFFFTGLTFLLQDFADYFAGSLLGKPKYLLDEYQCPEIGGEVVQSPVPAVFDIDYQSLQDLNALRNGMSAWQRYGISAKQRAKAMRDINTSTPEAFVKLMNQNFGDDYLAGSPHFGAVDVPFSSYDNVHPEIRWPFEKGLIVKAGTATGYGNVVAGCYSVRQSNGELIKMLSVFAHMDPDLRVKEGQTVVKGDLTGFGSNTGVSSGALGGYHLHWFIQSNLRWVSNYADMVDGGYLLYFPKKFKESLVKMVDPVVLMLRPDLAYQVIKSPEMKALVWNHGVSEYLSQGLSTQFFAETAGSSETIAVAQDQEFGGFDIVLARHEVVRGDLVDGIVKAIDRNGNVLAGYKQEPLISLSNRKLTYAGPSRFLNGELQFSLQAVSEGEDYFQVSDGATTIEEVNVSVLPPLQYLEVTAPQKILTEQVASIVVKAKGPQGQDLSHVLSVDVGVFPSVIDVDDRISLSVGRGEIIFSAENEGIYRVDVSSGNVRESVTIEVENGEQLIEESLENEEANHVPNSAEALMDRSLEAMQVHDEQGSDELKTSSDAVVSEELEVKGDVQESDDVVFEEVIDASIDLLSEYSDSAIVIPDSADYKVLKNGKGQVAITFQDKDLKETYWPPILDIKTVPGTQAVSIFTGFDFGLIESGEFKLTKYDSKKGSFSYYPTYKKGQKQFKKMVMYGANGEVLDQLEIGVFPRSTVLFTDVVEGFVDDELYDTIEALVLLEVVKGNPDGSFGVDASLNRAAAATLLFRIFKPDVDLGSVDGLSNPFKDLVGKEWYYSAMLQAANAGVLKGSDGKVFADQDVWVEQLLAMIARILGVEVMETDPWYDGFLSFGYQYGLISDTERALLGKGLPRGIVARIMVRALESLNSDSLDLTDSSDSLDADLVIEPDGVGGPVENLELREESGENGVDFGVVERDSSLDVPYLKRRGGNSLQVRYGDGEALIYLYCRGDGSDAYMKVAELYVDEEWENRTNSVQYCRAEAVVDGKISELSEEMNVDG